jgi:hypothetical protein
MKKVKKTFWDNEFELIDLSDEFNNDLIFDLISAIKFMYLAVEHNELVLGGDIYWKDKNGDYVSGCENWYCDEPDPQKTLLVALDYLNNCVKINPNIDWKVSVSITRKGTGGMICTPKVRHFWRCIFL